MSLCGGWGVYGDKKQSKTKTNETKEKPTASPTPQKNPSKKTVSPWKQ